MEAKNVFLCRTNVAVMFTIVLLLSGIGALTAQTTWNCGAPNTADVIATLDGDTLTVSGKGSMQNFISYAPWYDSRNSIRAVKVLNGVTSIGTRAFRNCIGITYVSIANDVQTIGNWAFSDCSGLTDIVIPNSVTSLAQDAFRNSGVTSLTIGTGIKIISASAFVNCKRLTHLTIPDNVTSIEDRAFMGCEALSSLNLGHNLQQIEFSAFDGCSSLTSLIIPNSVTSIGNTAFSRCSSLESLTIGKQLENIGLSTFAYTTNLKSVTIPGNVKTIGESAFFRSGLESVILENGITKIDETAFAQCAKLTSVIVPNSVLTIEYAAFSSCENLISVTLGDGLTNIGIHCFIYCKNLTSITIPKTVTVIGEFSFSSCVKMTKVTNLNPIPQSINRAVFNGLDISKDTLYVPDASVDAYKQAPVWKDFGKIWPLSTSAANMDVPSGEAIAYIYDNKLHISSMFAEDVSVYSLSGSMIYKIKKDMGDIAFDIPKTLGQVLIVKGSSGWNKKVAHQ
jgi:hypothetical protein